jgi:hypothetical protein
MDTTSPTPTLTPVTTPHPVPQAGWKAILLTVISAPTIRRLLVTAITALVVLVNGRFGVALDGEELAGLVLLALGYLAQSALVDRARILTVANAAAAAASAKVATVGDAAAVLGRQ